MRTPLDRPRPLFATCDHGLEEVLAAELTALGMDGVRPAHRGVAFSGDLGALWRANLWCRTANRILLPVAEFHVADRRTLYEGVKRVDWPSWFALKRTIAVDATGTAPGLDHAGFVAQVAKDAVCDRFRDACGKRPDVDRRRPDVPLYVRLDGGRGVVGLDASGARLHRRGYRTEAGEAPLKETLAAGILELLDWTPGEPLQDPTCGAGTFPIEAALKAENVAPGLLRLGGEGFAFERWRFHDEGGFLKVVADARAARVAPSGPIRGTDAEPDAIAQATRNAERAGVRVDFEVQPLSDVTPSGDAGVVVANPPYGKRLEVGPELYRRLGHVLKRHFSGWRAGILAADEAPAGAIGLRADRRLPLRNGPVPCKLHVFSLYPGRGR